MADQAKFLTGGNGRAALGLALLFAGLAAASIYMSGRRIEAHLTSRIVAMLTVFALSVILVVLPLCSIIVIHEIRKRMLAEEEIKKLNNGLADRNAELAATVRELETFTYSVAHDLRAPLRHIDGFSRILQEDLGPSLDADAAQNLERIREATRNMGHLVDDLLNLSRVGRQALKLQTVELNTLVKEAITSLAAEISSRDAEWRIGPLPLVECDPGLTKQVLSNLLSNALKYSRPREHAVIEIGQVSAKGAAVFFVRDNGVGFDMKYADKLFGVFQRLHRAEDFEGTGVGLAIAQRIIHKHRGRIWAEAEPDKGATFYFTLGPRGDSRAEVNATPGEESWSMK